MLANGFISVGGSEIGDLTDVHDPEIIRDRLTRSMPDRSPRAIALYVGYWRRFLWDAQPGDLVVLPTRDRRVAFGELTGKYHYVDVPEPRARHRRPVFWATTGISRDAFGSDLLKILNGQHTVQEFTAPGAVERLQRLASTGHDPGPTDG
jgi:restriction system protein